MKKRTYVRKSEHNMKFSKLKTEVLLKYFMWLDIDMDVNFGLICASISSYIDWIREH